jgi:hypothetical protein
VDLVSRLEMILRGKVSNVGAPIAYSAWNLPPSKTFTQFVSNPPAGDGGLGLRVRPSAKEVSALVALLGEIPDDERQVHFEVPLDPSDAEISAMLDMLAEDSSDTTPAGTLAVAPLLEASKALDIQKSASARPKRPCRASQPASPADGQKRKKRRLRRVSSLDRDAGPSAPAAQEVPVPEFTEADPNEYDQSSADSNGCTVRVVDENEEEEEDEIPLIRKNSRRYIASGESSGVPSPALSALVGLCWGEGKAATLRSKSSPLSTGPMETKRAGTPFARYDIRRRPTTRSSHRAASSSSEAHVRSGPL